MERGNWVGQALRVAMGFSLAAILGGCYASGGAGVYQDDQEWAGPGYVDEGYGTVYYGGYRRYHDHDGYAFRDDGGRHGVHDADQRGRASMGRGDAHGGAFGGGGGHAESHGGGVGGGGSVGGHAGGGGGGGGHR